MDAPVNEYWILQAVKTSEVRITETSMSIDAFLFIINRCRIL